jgi:FtsP/CotA-like multicopper oxidase with cupredoxin domain
MQVASGMAGTLVIEGNRYPDARENGDLDTLLKTFQPKIGAQGEVMMLQQIPYACFNNIEQTDVNKDASGGWICNDEQVGVVENFGVQVGNFKAWGDSGRYPLINGQARPRLKLDSARVYRWRLVDAGFNETVNLRIRKVGDTSRLSSRLTTSQQRADEVEDACTGVDVTQFEVASDGLTHSQIVAKTVNTLQPGYRSDILFALPEPGVYCVYDDKSESAGSVSGSDEKPKILALIDARDAGKRVDQTAFITRKLVEAAQGQPASVRSRVMADLRDGLKLTKFVPHPPISDAELAASNQRPISIEFNMSKSNKFLINGEAYKSGVVNQTLILGAAQTWKLSSLNGSHPFHIHVNPFEIVAIRNYTGRANDPQYDNLIGTWKDTLMVIPGYEIEVRTRYERYIGEFVLHCHILDHEDQGMMQNVQVVLPDGNGGAQHKGHH